MAGTSKKQAPQAEVVAGHIAGIDDWKTQVVDFGSGDYGAKVWHGLTGIHVGAWTTYASAELAQKAMDRIVRDRKAQNVRIIRALDVLQEKRGNVRIIDFADSTWIFGAALEGGADYEIVRDYVAARLGHLFDVQVVETAPKPKPEKPAAAAPAADASDTDAPATEKPKKGKSGTAGKTPAAAPAATPKPKRESALRSQQRAAAAEMQVGIAKKNRGTGPVADVTPGKEVTGVAVSRADVTAELVLMSYRERDLLNLPDDSLRKLYSAALSERLNNTWSELPQTVERQIAEGRQIARPSVPRRADDGKPIDGVQSARPSAQPNAYERAAQEQDVKQAGAALLQLERDADAEQSEAGTIMDRYAEWNPVDTAPMHEGLDEAEQDEADALAARAGLEVPNDLGPGGQYVGKTGAAIGIEPDSPFADMEIISAYSAEDALRDGDLVDVSSIAKTRGFTIRTMVSRSIHDACERGQGKDPASYTARMGDVLHMLYMAIKAGGGDDDRLNYGVRVGKTTLHLQAIMDGAGITIVQAGER